MDFAKHYRTDETGEAEGVWIDWAEGARLKVARLGNPTYQKRFQALLKPHRHLRDRGLLPEDVQSEILNKCIAETILVDWEGVEYEGKALPYSSDNALKLISEFKDFREDILTVAGEQAVYRQTEVDESSKNSPKSSSGKSSGGNTPSD